MLLNNLTSQVPYLHKHAHPFQDRTLARESFILGTEGLHVICICPSLSLCKDIHFWSYFYFYFKGSTYFACQLGFSAWSCRHSTRKVLLYSRLPVFALALSPASLMSGGLASNPLTPPIPPQPGSPYSPPCPIPPSFFSPPPPHIPKPNPPAGNFVSILLRF